MNKKGETISRLEGNKLNFASDMSQPERINIKKLIASKNEKALRWIPGFVIRYLEKILHQDEINQFLHENKDKKNAEWCDAAIDFLDISFSVKSIENIPKDGKVVLAMNHPLGGIDALILVSALKGHRDDLKFIVNDLLMNLENMQEMFVGVNKHGKNKSSIRVQIKELFQSDQAVCIFPAGLVSRQQRKEVKDLVWKKTFVTYSREYDRTIIPIYIDGGLSNFFYRLARWRKRLGIKMNLEMLYLSNEMFKLRGRHFQFIVGDAVNKDVLHQGKEDHVLSEEIKEMVYELRKQL